MDRHITRRLHKHLHDIREYVDDVDHYRVVGFKKIEEQNIEFNMSYSKKFDNYIFTCHIDQQKYYVIQGQKNMVYDSLKKVFSNNITKQRLIADSIPETEYYVKLTGIATTQIIREITGLKQSMKNLEISKVDD